MLAVVVVAIVGRTVGQMSPGRRVDSDLPGYDGTVGCAGSGQILTVEGRLRTGSWRAGRFEAHVLGELHVHVTVEFLRRFASVAEEMIAIVGWRNWRHLVRSVALLVQHGSTLVVILRVHLGVVHGKRWIHVMRSNPVLREAWDGRGHGVPSVRHRRRNVILAHHLR